MTTTDYAAAMKKALEAGPEPITTDLLGDRYMRGDYSMASLSKAQDALVHACHPAALRSLLDERELSAIAVQMLAGEVERLRNALDHIIKTCRASRSQTRRIRWIEARAYGALTGRENLHNEIDLPKSAGPDTAEKLEARNRLDRYVARVSQGLATGILSAHIAALKDTK